MRLAMHADVHTWRAGRPALSHVKPLHCILGPGGLSLPTRRAPGGALARRKMGLAAASEAAHQVLYCFVVHSAQQAELRRAPHDAPKPSAPRALYRTKPATGGPARLSNPPRMSESKQTMPGLERPQGLAPSSGSAHTPCLRTPSPRAQSHRAWNTEGALKSRAPSTPPACPATRPCSEAATADWRAATPAILHHYRNTNSWYAYTRIRRLHRARLLSRFKGCRARLVPQNRLR